MCASKLLCVVQILTVQNMICYGGCDLPIAISSLFSVHCCALTRTAFQLKSQSWLAILTEVLHDFPPAPTYHSDIQCHIPSKYA